METVKNRELFEDMPIPRAVRTMAIPTIIGQVIILVYSIADTFFIGRTNDPYMVAGASLILPVFNICLSVGALAGVGGGSKISRLLGQGRTDEAAKIYSYSVYLAVFSSLLFSLTVLFFMRPIMSILGAGEKTYAYASSYAMCVIVFGGLPTIMTNVLSQMLRSIGESRKAAFGVAMGGIINIALDPLFMFVLLPDGYEIIGAGVATCLSNCISCGYFIFTIRHLGQNSVLKLLRPGELPERKDRREVLSVGLPAALATLLFDLDYIIIDRLMSAYSDIALAAIGIVLKAERLPLNIGIGICQGMDPIVAYNYTARNYRRMRGVTRFSLLLGIGCAVISVALYELFAPYIMRFFIADADTVEIGTFFLRARCVATIFMFLSFFHVHLFNDYGQGRTALFLGMMRWLAFNIPLLLILNRIFGVNGIVWAQATGDIMTVTLSLLVHRHFLKKNNFQTIS